jgi:Na+/H+ antiporter NhaC
MRINKYIITISYILLLVFPFPILAAAYDPQNEALWYSILPPLVAIVFALTLKQVIPALFLGVWLGAWAILDFGLAGLWGGLLDTFQIYVLKAFANPDHAAVVLFSMMIGGTIGIISRNGGMQGIVDNIVRWADSARRAMLATASMGLAIFFDDYANTLVVGNTMRPMTDSMGISRAKLAYIVDSTAAPVSCIALVTTWIGYEVGLIGDAIDRIPGLDVEAYLLLLSTIPYSFYPILAILFVFMVAYTGRDFGPMLDAERRARSSNADPDAHLAEQATDDRIDPVPGKPRRAINAVLPIVVLVGGVVAGLIVTGLQSPDIPADPRIQDIIGNADSYKALMWGSLVAMLTAATLTMAQGIMNLEDVVNSWYQGARSMFYAMIILLLAWALGEVTEVLGTAHFLVEVLGDTLPAAALPAIIFVLAAATAFATGTSWGAMGILTPLAIPLTWAVLESQGIADAQHMHILYSAIASVLAGSVWGDHCSPISDTTILSSMASGCDHIEHVRTQLPYAMTVGLTSILTGSIPVAMGMPWWLGLLIGAAVLVTLMIFIGRESHPAATT